MAEITKEQLHAQGINKLAVLKQDLQIMSPERDDYLQVLLFSAAEMIEREGIDLTGSIEDGMLEIMYAAYLYRRRKDANPIMPRMLRYALNNRLLSQKMRGGACRG